MKKDLLKSLSELLQKNKNLLEKFEFALHTSDLEILSRLDEAQIDNILSVSDERMQFIQLYLYLTESNLTNEMKNDAIYSLYEASQKQNNR